MKIAYDAKRFFQNASGLGNYSRDLIRILAEHFPENDYLLYNIKLTERGSSILALPHVSYHHIKKRRLARQLLMGKQSQRDGADIFHGLSGELPLRWQKKSIKKVVTIHDLIFERFPQYYSLFDGRVHFWKFQRAATNADAVIAISEQTKADIIHFLKVPEEKITVIYQGCHPAFQKIIDDDALQNVRQKYALPKRFVLNVGTIEPRKNLLRVVHALKDSDIPLVVVGNGKKYKQKVQTYTAQNNIQVQFLENVSMPELAAIYRCAEVFIYPSEFEGFGIPVLEALFSRTCVITSNVSSLPEAGGPDSMYVDPYNVDDIRAKLIFLWNNPAERRRREDKGYDYAQNFTDEKIAQKLMAFYRSLCR